MGKNGKHQGGSDLTPPYRESTPEGFNGWPEAGRFGPQSQGAAERAMRAALCGQARNATEQRLMNLASGNNFGNNSEEKSEENEADDCPPHRADRPPETSIHRGEVSKQGGSGAKHSGLQGQQIRHNTGQSSSTGSHSQQGGFHNNS